MPLLLTQFSALAVLLAFSAFFSGSETAIFSLTKLEQKRLRARHPKTWNTISRLLTFPRRTLITILIGNMIVNTLAAAVATQMALQYFGPKGVGISIALFTFVLVVTAEMTPKVFAVQYNEWFAFISAIPLDVTARVLFPIRFLVRRIADKALSLLAREKGKDIDLVSEPELKALARIGEEEGVIRPEEGRMIKNLIGLSDRIAREIMTPRTDLVAFDVQEPPEKLIQMIQQYHFSHFPVYQGDLDHLLGLISTQEFMLDERKDIRSLLKKPAYIPETKPVDELLHEFREKKTRIAICVDEYGGTAGLVTVEDILEEIFGEFYDEYAKEKPLVERVDQDAYVIDGKIPLHELNSLLGISLMSQTSETLNGWLLEKFGKIPEVNDALEWSGNCFSIKEMIRRRIVKVELKLRR